MFARLLNCLFGCSHRNYSFPFTNRKGVGRSGEARSMAAGGTYVVCLDCGKEFAYDWQTMKIVGPREGARPAKQVSLHILPRRVRAWKSHAKVA